MPDDTDATPTPNGKWWQDQPRYPRGHPRAGQFIRESEPPEIIPFLGKLDKRTARAETYLDVLDSYIADCGGREAVSHAEAALCKQAAGLETLLTEHVTDYLAGREVNVETWLGAVGHFRRVVTTLGLQRHAHEINPRRGLRYEMGLE